MRKAVVLCTLVVLLAAPVASASARVLPDTGPRLGPVELVQIPQDTNVPLTSDNVSYHGTIPFDSPGVGGEVVHHADGNTYFYVTGLKGLSIYNVSNPALPILTGFFPFPHSQNEDLKVSADGSRAVIAADGALAVPVNPVTVGITLIDTSDPSLPVLLGRTALRTASNHTAECADPQCEWIYGSGGNIYDARDPSNIITAGVWRKPGVNSAHAMRRDETGLIITDSTTRLVLDPRDDPANPVELARGTRVGSVDNNIQHNNVRVDAAGWVPRDPANPNDAREWVVVRPGPRSISASDKRSLMRPGELVIGNAESNIRPTCSTAGGLSTWNITDFDKGQTMEQLEVFRPLSGTWADGSPPVNALGCSGHWFTVNDDIVAASWYEHGVHFFRVRKDTGSITEIGFFQPVVTEAGASYWVDDTYVYNVDYARGIDIISFDNEAKRASQQELDAAWLRNLGQEGPLASNERYFCRLAD